MVLATLAFARVFSLAFALLFSLPGRSPDLLELLQGACHVLEVGGGGGIQLACIFAKANIAERGHDE